MLSGDKHGTIEVYENVSEMSVNNSGIQKYLDIPRVFRILPLYTTVTD